MLGVCVLELQGSWDKYLLLVEFYYNNSFQATIEMAPYEALYGKRSQTAIHWHDNFERKDLGKELVDQATEAIQKIQQRMKNSQSR